MNQSPEMKWLADSSTRTLYCNAPLLGFLGVAQLEGLAWHELIHPDDQAEHIALNSKAFARREPYLSRYRMRHADGKFKLVLQHAVPQFTPKGVFIGFLGTMIQEPEPITG